MQARSLAAQALCVLPLLLAAPALAQDTDVAADTDVAIEAASDGATTSVRPQAEAPGTELAEVIARIPRFSDVRVRFDGPVIHVRGSVRSARDRDDLSELVRGRAGDRYVDLDVEVNESLLPPVGPDGETESVEEAVGRLADESVATWARLKSRAPLIVLAAAVVVTFVLAAWAVRRWTGLFQRISKRPLVRNTVRQLVSAGLILLGIVLALEILQVTALISAVLGTAGVLGLAVGFAFRDIVENYLAGLMLAFQQPFSKDDVVEIDDVSGVVVRLTTRNTLLLTFDGNHVYLPNATVFKAALTNYSRHPFRRFNFKVGVGVDEDLAEVVQTGMATLCAMPGVTDDPAPQVQIDELGDSSVVMNLFGWVDQREHDFFAVRTEAIRRIKEAYDEAGYDMPEPIYRVAMQDASKKVPKTARIGRETPVVELAAQDELQRSAEQARRDESGEDLLEEDAAQTSDS